jgi:hypothetical protein
MSHTNSTLNGAVVTTIDGGTFLCTLFSVHDASTRHARLFGTSLNFTSFFLASVADAFTALNCYLLASFLFASLSRRSVFFK